MKLLQFYIATFLLTCVILVITTSSQNKFIEPMHSTAADTEGFVVMELFTSQGCSSCPPADNLLGKYAAMNNDHIIPLAFHVDYWNRLGWTDSFSSSIYSRRQRDYAMIIDNSSVFTPQLVVNGENQFVGSDADKISMAVNNALKSKVELNISINELKKNGNNILVSYNLDKEVKNMTMQAALVQKQVFTNILKGENRGLKLVNYNVVRDFNSRHISITPAIIDLNIPPGYNEKDFEIVLYVQDDASGKIISAVKRALHSH